MFPDFFFLQKQVLWSSLNVAPRPCQERGGAPWAWLTGNIAWLVLSFPHRANSSGPEPLSIFRHPSLSPGCRQPVLREPSTAQGSRLPSVLPELLPGRVSSTFAQVSACGWGGEPCSQIRACFRKRICQQSGRGWSLRGPVSYRAALTVHTLHLH